MKEELAVMLSFFFAKKFFFVSIAHSSGSQTYSRTFNVLADCLSRFHNPVNTQWELLQVVFDSVVLRWDRPHVDLFATSLNHKLETFVSPVPDSLVFAVDAMSLSWDGMFAYAFPPFRFLLQVLLKIK